MIYLDDVMDRFVSDQATRYTTMKRHANTAGLIVPRVRGPYWKALDRAYGSARPPSIRYGESDYPIFFDYDVFADVLHQHGADFCLIKMEQVFAHELAHCIGHFMCIKGHENHNEKHEAITRVLLGWKPKRRIKSWITK